MKRTNIGDIVLMSRIISSDLLAAKLDEAMSASVRDLTARDARIPLVPGKAIAVIGVRRGGKTSFMRRRMAERIAAGRTVEVQRAKEFQIDKVLGRIEVHDHIGLRGVCLEQIREERILAGAAGQGVGAGAAVEEVAAVELNARLGGVDLHPGRNRSGERGAKRHHAEAKQASNHSR